MIRVLLAAALCPLAACTQLPVMPDIATQTPAPHAQPTLSSFEFADPIVHKTLTVWSFAPTRLGAHAPVLIVMHGASRTARGYCQAWAPHVERKGYLLLCPEFSKREFPDAESYNLGNLERPPGRGLAGSSFAIVERIFDAATARYGNRSDRYTLYGHSAGGQFVQRMLWFYPQARVDIALAANPGWYTWPDDGIEYPYGTAHAPPHDLSGAYARRFVLLLGEEDIDPQHPQLNRSQGAMAQGGNRLERGLRFFAAARDSAKRIDAPFAWTMQTVPGADHDNAKMAPAAAALLP